MRARDGAAVRLVPDAQLTEGYRCRAVGCARAARLHGVGRFEEALMHALADGRIDGNESQELWALLRSVLKEAADMLPCLKSNGGER